MTLRIPSKGYSRNIIQLMTLRIPSKGYSRNIPSYSLITLCAILNFQKIYCGITYLFRKFPILFSSLPHFVCGVHFTHSFVYCVEFCRLSFCYFSFGKCIVCPLAYSFWILLWLWYIKTCLCAAHIFLVNILCATTYHFR